MSNSEFTPDKLFTVEDANKCLPLVRAIVRDISSLSLQVQERRQRLSQLAREESSSANDPYAEETDQIRSQLESDIRELERFENELTELGVECKHGPDGIVDFPCMMDGRLVYLCSVSYTHLTLPTICSV